MHSNRTEASVTARPAYFVASPSPVWASNHGNGYTLPYAFSRIPEFLHDWVSAIATKLDVDPGMVLATLLSGMGAGLNGRVVIRPDGGAEPLACFTVVLAGATTGKTRTHKLVHLTHNEIDIWRYKRYQQERRCSTGAILDLNETPSVPSSPARLRSVLLQDTSNRGLLEAVEGVGESTAISIHEGQRALESVLFRKHLDTLNVLHDGEGRVMITRGKSDRVIAHNATLAILVMVQREVFGYYLDKHGEMARTIGFLARCLFAIVPPFRTFIELSSKDPEECLASYHSKVGAFLNDRLKQLEAGETDPVKVSFSPEACRLWHELLAEHHNLTNSIYWHIQDAANRGMQNVARIAGILHSYDDAAGDISPETLDAAWAIVQWHLTQFAELFPPKPPPPLPPRKPSTREKQLQREVDDANAILNCVTDLCLRNREPDALKSKVFVRSGLYNARFRTALMRLVDEGVVLESGEGNQTRLSIVPQRDVPLNQTAWYSYNCSL